MNTTNKVRAEIERLKAKYRKDMYKSNHEGLASGYKIEAYNELLSFLDTLESEKPMNFDSELDEEIKKVMVKLPFFIRGKDLIAFARHFAQWGAEHAKIDVTDFCKPIDPGIAQCIADNSWEMLGEDERPVTNDLEEAAEEWAKENYGVNYMDFDFTQDAAFRAMYHFRAGAKWQKEQMLKEAVEADVNIYRDIVAGKSWAEFVVEIPTNNLGDKVHIIIVKKEKE